MSKYAGNTTVELKRPQRSQFDMSHTRRLTTRAGRLTPCFIAECVPGDTWRGSSEVLLRLAPLLAPIYDEITLTVHYFFVPNRLLWDEWEEFITGGRLGGSVAPDDAPIPPYFDIGDSLGDSATIFAKSTLPDYLGVPDFTQLPGYVSPTAYEGCTLDAMPFFAYQKVYMDYYRDRNYVADTAYDLPQASGVKAPGTWFNLQTRGWQADYFTAALPFTQRGDEVLMPLAGTGSVSYMNVSQVFDADGDPSSATGNLQVAIGDPQFRIPGIAGGFPGRIENIDEINFDASSVSINDFRTAYALQVWLERNAVAGSRYVESLYAHFAVRSQDMRLQRAEFLGGGRIRVKISEIVSTAYSSDGEDIVPLANLAGHGVTYGNTNQFRYFCPEHGFVIGIMSIMSPASYHQGLPRMFRRRSFLDYPWPTFAKLGEQQVDKAELFASAANLTPNADGVRPLFGYQSRYADWKQIHNTNHGEFHDTLLFWTLTRHFSSSPTLGNTFVTYDAAVQDRIFAVNGTSDNFWCYINNSVDLRRLLPYFGQPNTLNFA